MSLILIIDDEEQIREVLHTVLDRVGHEVLEADNGKEGLKKYNENDVDLVITDIIMPDTEGLETIARIRREFPGLKIVAMSGGGRVVPGSHLDHAALLGASRTFTKPLNMPEFVDAIHETLAPRADRT